MKIIWIVIVTQKISINMVYKVTIFKDNIIDIEYDIDYDNDKNLYLDILEGIMYHIIDNIFLL